MPDPQQRRRRDVNPDDLGRQVELELRDPDDALQRQSRQMRVSRVRSSRSASRRRASHHVATASTPSAAASTPWRLMSQLSVDGALEGEAVDDVAGSLAARVRAGRRRRRPDEDRHASEHEQRPHGARGRAVRGRLLAVGERRPRPPRERAGGDEDGHRQQVVPHDPAGSEAVEHGQPTHDGLADDAQREQHAQDCEVAPERHPEEGQQARGDGRQGHEAGEHPIAELDPRVGVEFGDETAVGVALRPVRTAEARPGDAHGGPGEDDHGQRGERDGGDHEVALG